MIRWSMNLVVWSLYVELCTAPLLPIFHRLARSNSRRVDLAAIASLVAISVLLWGHLWIAYWFAFYVGMTVETRGREWACLVRDRFGGAGFMTAVSYAAMVAPAMLMPNGPLVAVLETAGAFSIISLVVWSSETSMFQFLEHPLARWTGRVSYSFYLWHFFVLTMAMRILYALLPAELLYRYDLAVFAATAVLTVALALGVANLSYAFIEIPFIVLGRRVVAGWRGLRPPPAAVSTGTLSGTSD
jgi:peptidoglycan/LPS O-acetylase OafA/YrhL